MAQWWQCPRRYPAPGPLTFPLLGCGHSPSAQKPGPGPWGPHRPQSTLASLHCVHEETFRSKAWSRAVTGVTPLPRALGHTPPGAEPLQWHPRGQASVCPEFRKAECIRSFYSGQGDSVHNPPSSVSPEIDSVEMQT